MKSNLISAIAGWKSAALLALVAMVAAVAFSGILTSTNSADAAGPGDTTPVTATSVGEFTSGENDGIATFTISGGSASGSFAANGGQSIVCANDSACDVAKDGADDGQGGTIADDTITVLLAIDDDSPNGFILISIQDAANPTETAAIVRVNVTTADRVTAIKASATIGGNPAPAPAVSATGTGEVVITAKLENSVEGPVNGKPVIIFTTLGVLDGCGGDQPANNGVQACTESSADLDSGNAADVDDQGRVQVTLKPTGRAGLATVNFTHGALSAAVDVVFYGATASIEASAMQSSVAIGGVTYIVVTATDSGGNPVVGHQPVGRSQGVAGGDADGDGVVGPGPKAVEVDIDVDQDFIHPANPKANLPACGDFATDDPETTDVNEATRFAAGTNAAGKCVIKVTAPLTDDGNPTNDATRGTNTVNIKGPGATATDTSKDVAVEIQVGGAPSEISTDAPARVDALSSTKVTITVVDDEGVRVGAVPSSVTQVEGDGAIIAGAGAGMTSDGVTSFTYLAPSRSGTAVFRVTAGSGAGTISHNVVIDIGPEPDEEPEGPAPTWNAPLTSGTHNLVWNGEDGADPSAGAGEGVTAIWQWNGSSWDGYFPSAADVPGGNTLTSLSNGSAYWVIVE